MKAEVSLDTSPAVFPSFLKETMNSVQIEREARLEWNCRVAAAHDKP